VNRNLPTLPTDHWGGVTGGPGGTEEGFRLLVVRHFCDGDVLHDGEESAPHEEDDADDAARVQHGQRDACEGHEGPSQHGIMRARHPGIAIAVPCVGSVTPYAATPTPERRHGVPRPALAGSRFARSYRQSSNQSSNDTPAASGLGFRV